MTDESFDSGQPGRASKDATDPVGERRIWPRWAGLLCGKLILRVCPSAPKKGEVCEGCRLRVLCKCAYEDYLAAMAVERRFWILLAACGAMTIVIALLALLKEG